MGDPPKFICRKKAKRKKRNRKGLVRRGMGGGGKAFSWRGNRNFDRTVSMNKIRGRDRLIILISRNLSKDMGEGTAEGGGKNKTCGKHGQV